MEAGRELDALVAEKVMGCTVVHGMYGPYCHCRNGRYGLQDHAQEPDRFHGGARLADYSTDIKYAWQVVEKLSEQPGWLVSVGEKRGPIPTLHSGRWVCDIFRWNETSVDAEADTAPLAICLAALTAVGALVPA